MIRVLVLGSRGQLGSCLRDIQPSEITAQYADIDEVDITVEREVGDFILKANPDYLVNCAAYTAVDKAEEEDSLAFRVNRDAVGFVASVCKAVNASLIHISTDFVFDGRHERSYRPDDKPRPLGVYGQSKLAGEILTNRILPACSMILRTAWLYSEYGQNFVLTMLRLMAERDEISVVDDQTGTPTYARGLARVIWRILTHDRFEPGIYHWTDGGVTTWHGFAREIQRQALATGLLDREIPVRPIPTSEYPTAAVRPAYSVLDRQSLVDLLEMKGVNWEAQLTVMLNNLKQK